MGHPIPDPPPPALPRIIQIRLAAMSLVKLTALVAQLTKHIKLVRANPPAGRDTEVLLLESAYLAATTLLAGKNASIVPPPTDTDNALTQAVAAINTAGP